MISKIFGLELEEFDVKKCLPPKETWVIVDLFDDVNNTHKIKSAYFDEGSFWDSSREDAYGVENKSWTFNENKERILNTNLKVIKWGILK